MSRFVLLGAGLALAMPAAATDAPRQVPLSDTEDAGIGFETVGSGGRLHPVLGLDLRNGDYVRGSYDDDGAGLGRLPVHAQLGLVYELGSAAWLEVRSSNGFHAPRAGEAISPRAWYESNSLAGIAVRLAPSLVGAATYAIKASPNGVSATTHEVSGALSWETKAGLGALHPGFAATWRPRGGGGLYTQATLAPDLDLGRGGGAGRLSVPVAVGVGWSGFYGARSGRRLFGRVGFAYRRPFTIGGVHLSARAETSALIRDAGLRRLEPAPGSRHAVRPFAQIGLTCAY